MGSRVFLSRCGGYRSDLLQEIIVNGFTELGYAPSNLKNALTVVKPNLLTGAEPDRAVVTHPEVFRAVIRVLKNHGARPVLVESPATQSLQRVMKKTGYDAVVTEENVEVWDHKKTGILRYENAFHFKRFEIAAPLFDADYIINIPKLKTHGLTYMTCAVKNLFGTIPGLNKSKWHMRAKTKEEFSEFLLDFYGAFVNGFEVSKNILHVVDAVQALEGEGPGSSGKPVSVGAVIIGTDAIAVDAVAAEVAGFDRSYIVTITSGGKRGLGASTLKEIEVVGDSLTSFGDVSLVPPTSVPGSRIVNFLGKTDLFKNLLVERPVPSAEKCTLCYQCKKICPAGAIGSTSNGRTPEFDYDRCIRCYCCMEICPEAAVSLKKGRLQWLMEALS